MSKTNKNRKTVNPPINCGWQDCVTICKNDWKLNEHLTEHLGQYQSNGCNHSCPWTNCEFDTKCIDELKRHVYYHGYYAGLLAQGAYELAAQPNLPKCKTTPRKDVIPLLERDFKCEWLDCQRSFASIVEFQDHIVQHACFEYEFEKSPADMHPKSQCHWSYCRKQLDNKYRLIEHIRTHTNKKQVACPKCGYIFRTKTSLYDHRRRQPDSNTPQKYQCAQCFKCFVTEKLLRAHVVKHVNCHKCSMCDMTCSSISSLAVHVRYRHLRDKPFKCTQCSHRCVRQNDLQKHMNYVHDKQMHRCDRPGCNYEVLSANLLRRVSSVFILLHFFSTLPLSTIYTDVIM